MSLVWPWVGPGCLLGLRQVSLGCLLVHRRMSLVCPWAVPGFLWGFVICVWDASWYIVVCLLYASWWGLGAYLASSYASWVPLVTSSYVSCVPLGGSWVPRWRRHMRLGCLLAHRRMSRLCLLVGPGFLGALSFASWGPLGTSSHVSCVSLVVSWVPLWLRQASCRGPLVHRRVSLACLWVEPWCLCGFVRCVLSASWDIVVCLVCASWWILGAFGASAYASGMPLGASSYVSCVHLGGSWAPLRLRHVRLGCLLGHRRMSLVCLGVGPGCLYGLRHMRLGWLLGQRRVSLVSPLVGSSGKSRAPLVASSYVSCVLLVGSLVPLGLRHLRLGYLVGHRRMFLARLLENL